MIAPHYHFPTITIFKDNYLQAAIERKNMQGGKGKFSLAIDKTQVAQVLEVSHVNGAIIGGE